MEQVTPPQYQPAKRDGAFLKLALSWAAAILIAIGLQQFVFQSYQVFGGSMEPTLHEGDYLIISKLGRSLAGLRGGHYIPDRGDIVVVDPDGTRLIKRVIGLPGDTVTVENGTVRVQNSEHPRGFDPYEQLGLSPMRASGDIRVVIPQNEIFVIGDNREGTRSSDSRNQLGTIPAEDIIGSLVLRLWPPRDAELF